MAAIDFPNFPTINQVFVSNNRSWTWDGKVWSSSGSVGNIGPQGPAGPAGPTGPAVVVTATAPILYNSGTRVISLDPNAIQDVEIEILMGVL